MDFHDMPTVARRMPSNAPRPTGTAAHSITHQPTASQVDVAGDISISEDFVEDTSFYDPQSLSPSNFSADLLSPEYASENPYSIASVQTTPSIEDILWEQNFNHSVADSGNATLSSSNFDALPTFHEDRYEQVHPYPHHQHEKYFLPSTNTPTLISPQLTNTPSPHENFQSQYLDNAIMPQNPQTPGPQPTMGGRNDLKSVLQVYALHTPAQSGPSSNASLQASPLEPIARAVSPVVMVSNYDKNNHPGQPQNGMTHSGIKRSRAFESSAFLAPGGNELTDEQSASQDDTANELRRPISRTENGEWLADSRNSQAGIEPTVRTNDFVPSLKDMEEKRQLDERNVEVETWLTRSEAGSDLRDEDGPKSEPGRHASQRRTKEYTSRHSRPNTFGLGIADGSNIPGPGVLVDEDSDEDYDESASQISDGVAESPPADVDISQQADDDLLQSVDETFPDHEEPLPRQFIRVTPWQDAMKGPLTDLRGQPSTSNAAIVKYDQQAAKFETASRAATWGTRRRLSEADVNSIIGDGNKMQQLSLAGSKSRERGSSFIDKARSLVPKRSSSNIKKKTSEVTSDPTSADTSHNRRGESLSSVHTIERKPSIGKTSKASKSPPLNTGSAFLAMTGQMAAVGRSTSATPYSEDPKPSPWNALKRQRSKSELPKASGRLSATPGLAELMSHHGGPPMPTLASPMHERPTSNRRSDGDDDEDEDDDGSSAEKGVKMEFRIQTENITPTFEGFKTHSYQLNPRLEPFLIERIGQEQIRRYKKLVENKVKHIQAVFGPKKCGSGKHCFELGGEATFLPPRTSAKDPDTTYAQFQVASNGESDNEENAFGDGLVTAALFPPGIPLPPVKRLPAEFECTLCFKVKKFQKPSDWTKHVHEDVQPFTCTFAHCAEPKSFKRKADWVRHENERHRHLEWWRCNMPECNHVCYRKDNFVQHLVREHKKPEPKIKGRVSTGSKARSAYANGSVVDRNGYMQDTEIDEVWQLVETCRYDTQRKPRDEACKFCGNICNSWKKLTVHLAKHMEQISMPVLELVKACEVSPDTVISPVEKYSQRAMFTPTTLPASTNEDPGVSRYAMNATLQYPTAASHSPVQVQGYYQPAYHHDPMYANGNQAFDRQAQSQPMGMAEFSRIHGLPQNMSYGPYQGAQQPQQFISGTTGGPVTYPPPYNAGSRGPVQLLPHAPRSHPVEHHPYNLQTGNIPATHFEQQQSHPVYSSPTETVDYPAHFAESLPQSQAIVPRMMGGVFNPHDVRPAMPISQEQIYDQRPPMIYPDMQAQGPETQQYMYQ